MKMQCMWMWILSAGMTLLAGILLGQGAHPAPTFEVASIKPAPPFSLENLQSGQLHVASITGSQANFQFVSLSDLLAYAFRAKPYQISGPSWIRDGRWDLVAKLPKGASQDRVPEWSRACSSSGSNLQHIRKAMRIRRMNSLSTRADRN